MRKRIIAFLMTLICIFVQANTVFAETEAFSDRTAGKADAEYLSMLRIIDDGINFEENVSRGMAIYTVLNALGQAEAAAGYDVPADFEEKNHIYAASAAYALLWGIITGETAEELRLDEAAAYSEVAEMLVRGLGYSAEAERLGGYTEYSVKLGLNKGVNKAGGNAINGYDLAIMICNALDVRVYDALKNERGEFLSQIYLTSIGASVGEGIVESDGISSVMKKDEDDCGYVTIDGQRMKNIDKNISDYVGYRVKYMKSDDDNSLLGYCVTKDNTVTTLSRENKAYVRNNVLYYKKTDTNKTYNIKIDPSAAVLYNYRLIDRSRLSGLDLSGCRLKLIINDKDNTVDVIFVEESRSFLAESVNTDKQTINIKYGTYNGSSQIELDNSKDDAYVAVTDINGNDAEIDSLNAGGGFSVVRSEDKKYIKIIILDDAISGVITNIDGDELFCGDSRYYNACDKALALNKVCVLYINENNELFWFEEMLDDEYVYLYKKFYDTEKDEIYVKVYGNSGIVKLPLSEKVSVDGIGMSDIQVILETIAAGNVVSVKMNSSGKIKTITSAEKYGGKKERLYSDFVRAFIDEEKNDLPFKFNEGTKFFVVPENLDEKDFGAVIKLEDDEKYNVQAYEYDENTDCVKSVVLTIDSEAERNASLTYKSDIGVVEKIRIGIDEDDQATYYISLYTDGKKEEFTAGQYADVFEVLVGVRKGDVIRYNANYGNEIVRVESVAKLSSDLDGFHSGKNTDDEKIYGSAMMLDKNVITNYSKYLYHEIRISTSKDYGDMSLVRVFAHTTNSRDSDSAFDDFYIFDKSAKTVTKASVDDIVSFEKSSEPSMVFIQKTRDNVNCIVIVEE